MAITDDSSYRTVREWQNLIETQIIDDRDIKLAEKCRIDDRHRWRRLGLRSLAPYLLRDPQDLTRASSLTAFRLDYFSSVSRVWSSGSRTACEI